MCKDYLEKRKKVLFNQFLIKVKLYQHCAETEKNQARDIVGALVEQIKVAEDIPGQLIEYIEMECGCRMSNIKARAKEIMYSDHIYV